VEPVRVDLPVLPGVPKHGTNVERERKKLLEQDRAMAKAGTLEAHTGALLESATDDVRLLRAGAVPIEGRYAARAQLAGRSGRLEVRPMGADVSAAGDLGYSYGLTLIGRDGGADTTTYLRIWRRDKEGRWRIALDLDVPVPRRAS
jgi:ketosteroid isomerase-like protein